MATLLSSLLGNGSKGTELSAEMRTILQEMQTERAQCEALLNNARSSLSQVQQLEQPIAKATGSMDAVAGRLTTLEERLAGLERLASLFQDMDDRVERLQKSQRQADARIEHAGQAAQRIEGFTNDLSQRVERALMLKEQLNLFLELEAPFRQLKTDNDQLRVQVEGTSEQLTRLREQQERVMNTYKTWSSKIDGFENRHDELSRGLQDKERRVAGLEQALRGMDGAQRSVDEVKRGLDTVKALGDFVAQKTAALEAQRGSIDRAVARAEHLDRAMQQIENGVRLQQENGRTLDGLAERVSALQALHEQILQRSREMEQVQEESGEQIRQSRAELAAARDEVRKTVERFEFERRSLDSASERVTDLRNALTALESRLAGLAESKQDVATLHTGIEALSTQARTLSETIRGLDTDSERIQGLRRELDQVTRIAREAGERVARIEEARPAVEAALRDQAQLQGAHALVKDALEQTQLASGELGRFREEQTETRSWLAGVERSMQELREGVEELRKLAPTIEFAQRQVQRVNESMAAVETRREFVEDLHRRLADLGTLGSSLDERGRELLSRMEAAEQRFVGLASQAEEAERLSTAVASLSANLEAAERQSGQIAGTVAGLEARCQSIEGLAERTRALRQEVEQRQHALEEAARDLERTSQLRQEAAASAQELAERSKRLQAELVSADRQATRIDALSTQLEDRATGLQQVEKRIDAFEERLGQWELVEQEVARSLDQLAARQGTVEALRADLDRMFVMADKTMADVRTITSAQPEIEESRTRLTELMAQLGEVRDMTSALDERKRQLAQAEGRLARLEALLIDVRSSLALLQGQKVVVDQAIEKAGSLQFLLKQAESMIEGLREERDMTTRVRAALAADTEEEEPESEVA